MEKTEASRCEEDQTPPVEYTSGSSTPKGSYPPVRCCGLRRCTGCIICWVITAVVLAVVIAIVVVFTEIYPTITYSGNLPEYDENLVANACGLPQIYDSAIISKSLFDHGLNGNTSSVCGHKIWVQGYRIDGTTVKGASLTLTVIDYCTDCGHGDLVAPGAYGALSEPPNGGYVDDDGASVKWHWLKPVPKLHL